MSCSISLAHCSGLARNSTSSRGGGSLLVLLSMLSRISRFLLFLCFGVFRRRAGGLLDAICRLQPAEIVLPRGLGRGFAFVERPQQFAFVAHLLKPASGK